MDALTHFILPYLLLYKYWAIFGITLIAALAFPVPPGTLLMASSAFAAEGYLSFGWVVLVGTLGNVAGDNIGYWLARRYGRDVLSRIGFRKILASEKYARIEARLRRRPGWLIFISRFEVFSNLAVNIICGLGRVPYRKYLVYESVGEFLQVLIYCGIGYAVGDNWESINGIISRFMLLLLLVIILCIFVFWKRILRHFAA